MTLAAAATAAASDGYDRRMYGLTPGQAGALGLLAGAAVGVAAGLLFQEPMLEIEVFDFTGAQFPAPAGPGCGCADSCASPQPVARPPHLY